MIKRLIFDVDGTLISGVDFTSCVEKTLKQLGVYTEENVKAFFVGDATYKKIANKYDHRDYTKHIGDTMKIEMPSHFLEVFFENLKNVVPNENKKLFNTLENLSKKYELVLLTNYFSESQLNRLNTMGVRHFFTACYGEALMKPNIDAYIQACGKNNPSECVMIGDDIYLDIECAQIAGLNTILINSENVSLGNVETIVVQRVEDIDDALLDYFN